MSTVVWLTIVVAVFLVVANILAIRWPWWSSIHQVVALFSAEAIVVIVAWCIGGIWLDGWAAVLCGLMVLMIPIIICSFWLLAGFLLFPPIAESDREPLAALSTSNPERKVDG